jgi:hypothetical protein
MKDEFEAACNSVQNLPDEFDMRSISQTLRRGRHTLYLIGVSLIHHPAKTTNLSAGNGWLNK